MYGPIYDAKRIAKASYKRCIKENQKFEIESVSDNLHDALLQKSNTEFWKIWQKKFGSKKNTLSNIEGLMDDLSIANGFANYFSNIGNESPVLNNNKCADAFMSRLSMYSSKLDLRDHEINVEVIDAVISRLKKGKAA
jgi:hypothetical protein